MDFIDSAKKKIVKARGVLQQPALVELFRDESGQDLIEYVLIASVLSLFAIAGVKGVAANVLTIWQNLAIGFAAAVKV